MNAENLTWFFEPKPATEEDIVSTEQAIGKRLPDDYRRFAKLYSGGSPNERDFEFAGVDGMFYAGVGEFFTLMPDDGRSIVQRIERTEFFPLGLVPFAGDAGGNHVCFDLRTQISNPPVVFWHHECRGQNDEVDFVALSFSAFLELLHKPINDEGV